MLDRAVPYLTFATAIGSGLVAGVFFAFSSFVMPALGRLPAEQGVAAMQAINVTVITPSFMGVFFGTAILSLVLALGSLAGWEHASAKVTLLACLVYLAGSIGVTIALNVPLNDLLATTAPGTNEAGEVWRLYLPEWTRWNSVRGMASAVAGTLFTWALLLRFR